jgi:hypothetical protein
LAEQTQHEFRALQFWRNKPNAPCDAPSPICPPAPPGCFQRPDGASFEIRIKKKMIAAASLPRDAIEGMRVKEVQVIHEK